MANVQGNENPCHSCLGLWVKVIEGMIFNQVFLLLLFLMKNIHNLHNIENYDLKF